MGLEHEVELARDSPVGFFAVGQDAVVVQIDGVTLAHDGLGEGRDGVDVPFTFQGRVPV